MSGEFLPLIQISCLATSTELEDRVRFRSYFQMLSSDADLALTFFGAIQQYEWRRVAFIVQNENLYTVVSFGTDLGR